MYMRKMVKIMAPQMNGTAALRRSVPSTERLELSMPSHSIRTCSIDGCNSIHHARGWCKKHYERWRRYGDPLVTHKVKGGTPEDRIWRRVQKSTPEKCWLWTSYKNDSGYGVTTFRGRKWLAHRVTYLLTFGEFDQDLSVLHRCDNPGCVNPNHLFLGTRSDNQLDMAVKGRSLQGEKNHFAKLSEDDVRELRRLHVQGWTFAALARRYGISRYTASRADRGLLWKHVA